MGKLKETVKNLMPNGSLIACNVPADYAITAGTDNHYTSRYNTDTAEHAVTDVTGSYEHGQE